MLKLDNDWQIVRQYTMCYICGCMKYFFMQIVATYSSRFPSGMLIHNVDAGHAQLNVLILYSVNDPVSSSF